VENQKGQVLLVVFMMLLLIGTLVGGVSLMWQSGVNKADLEIDSLRAFYIAQAGIERARAEIAVYGSNGYTYNPPLQPFGGGNYTVSISRPGGSNTVKDITSTGKFGNPTRVSTQTITMRVSRPGPGNNWLGNHSKTSNYWREQ
jgi:hypothetical protein